MSASKHRLYFLLQRAAHVLKTEADAALRESAGLTTAQAAVMSIIVHERGATQRMIAQTLMQQESAVTAMVNRLIKAGYVTKARLPADRRVYALTATEEGHAALRAIRPAFQTINAVLDDAFDAEDVPRLADGLKSVLDHLGRT